VLSLAASYLRFEQVVTVLQRCWPGSLLPRRRSVRFRVLDGEEVVLIASGKAGVGVAAGLDIGYRLPSF